MSFSQQPLGEFLERLAAEEPAPGGGAAAALTAAQAAALVAMAARFSRAQLSDADARAVDTDGVRAELLELAERDGAAYGEVLAAFRVPRDADPAARSERIRSALDDAARIPLQIAETAAAVAQQAALLIHRGNRNLRGDALTGVHLAAAAACSAAELVALNVELGSLPGELAERAGRAAASAGSFVPSPRGNVISR